MGLRQPVAAGAKVYTLPTEPTVRKKTIADYSMLFHGAKKIGKTLVAAEFPRAYFFQFEPGEGDSPIMGNTIQTWEDFKGYSKELIRNSQKYGPAVLDTAKIAYELAKKYICKKMGIDDPGDEGYGKGWGAVNREFNETMLALMNRGRGTIFISHSEEKEIKFLDGSASDMIVPNLPKGAREFCEAIVDIWAYFAYDEKDNRIIQIRGNANLAAGHRLQTHFCGISRIPMGNSPREAYTNFMKAFNTGPKLGTLAPGTNAEMEKGGDAPKPATVVRRVVG